MLFCIVDSYLFFFAMKTTNAAQKPKFHKTPTGNDMQLRFFDHSGSAENVILHIFKNAS